MPKGSQVPLLSDPIVWGPLLLLGNYFVGLPCARCPSKGCGVRCPAQVCITDVARCVPLTRICYGSGVWCPAKYLLRGRACFPRKRLSWISHVVDCAGVRHGCRGVLEAYCAVARGLSRQRVYVCGGQGRWSGWWIGRH